MSSVPAPFQPTILAAEARPMQYTRPLAFAIVVLGLVMLSLEFARPRVVSEMEEVALYTFAWGALGLYLLGAVREAPKAILSSLYQVYYFISVLAGATLVSFGARMNEIQQPGYANGAFWMLLVCLIVSLESIRVGYGLVERRVGNRARQAPDIVQVASSMLFILFVAAVSFSILYFYGSPLTSGVNRILFWSVIAPPVLSPVRILIFLTFFLVCCLAMGRVSRRIAFLGRVLFLIYVFLGVVLLGEKASLFIIYLSAFLFVFAANSERIAITTVSFVVILVAITLGLFVAYTYETSGLGADFVFARVALQAQIPWSVLLEPEAILSDGLGYLERNLEVGTLREEISGRYLPASVLAAHSESGTSLTGFMPAWQILFFGTSGGMIILIGFCIFLGAVQFYTVDAARRGKLILSFVLFSAHFQLLSIWYVGNFNVAIILLFFTVILGIISLAPKIHVGARGEGLNYAQ
ncbi:hypothetical protein [Qipengyuania sp. DGS5-3]|uniref:hypothetical protein n=1 Tax=Qipengyuania sp. DGS5-3 TaxID=3349632 RepID=UPI0036D2C096